MTRTGVLEKVDAMHALLVLRADALAGCTEASEEAAELERIVDTVERYEAKRWPTGKVVGGKRIAVLLAAKVDERPTLIGAVVGEMTRVAVAGFGQSHDRFADCLTHIFAVGSVRGVFDCVPGSVERNKQLLHALRAETWLLV